MGSRPGHKAPSGRDSDLPEPLRDAVEAVPVAGPTSAPASCRSGAMEWDTGRDLGGDAGTVRCLGRAEGRRP
ncbi:hypothetical protein GCM10009834_18380 [Streptomonospora arabica]